MGRDREEWLRVDLEAGSRLGARGKQGEDGGGGLGRWDPDVGSVEWPQRRVEDGTAPLDFRVALFI